MRKRTYCHREQHLYKPDNLVENITVFWGAWEREQRRRLGLGDEGGDNAKDDDIPESYVHNIVGTALLKSDILPLSLKLVSELVPNMVYDRQKFAAITLRVAEPMCTVLLFTSGKMVLTGCKSFVQCMLAAHEVCKLLQVGFPTHRIEVVDVSVQNVVGNVNLNMGEGSEMDLDKMLEENKVFCTYLKNMFPGLIYRPDHSPVVLLLFKSGKIVITGGKSLSDINVGWRALWPTVRKYIRSGL